MIRKKIINDLKDRIEQKTSVEPGVMQFWIIKNGRPFLKEEYETGIEGKMIRLLNCYDTETDTVSEKSIFDSFDLDEISNEPETRNRLKNQNLTKNE